MLISRTPHVNANPVWRDCAQTVRTRLLYLVPLLISFVTVLFIAHAPQSVWANGETIEVFRGRSGSYEMALGVLPEEPVVGIVQFSVSLVDVATGQTVKDAEVLIVARDDEGVPTYQSFALNTPEGPDYYVANFTFREPGSWTIDVEITDTSLGMAQFVIPLEIGRVALEAGIAGTFVFIGVMAAIAICAYMIIRPTLRRKRQQVS